MTALEGNDNSFAFFGLLITYALLYTVTFNHISFSHTCRQGNSIAHNLARHARHVNSLAVWMEDVTPHLNDILLVDYGQFPLFNIIQIFFLKKYIYKKNNNNTKLHMHQFVFHRHIKKIKK